MNNKINEDLRNLESKIKNANINDWSKEKLYEIKQAILTSKRGRLYISKSSSYVEYLALRDQPGDNESDLSFCVVKRVIEEYSGATAVRAYEFLSFKELINYYQKNRAAIDLEIAAA